MNETNSSLVKTGGYNPSVVMSEAEIAEAQVWLKSIVGQRSGITTINDGLALIMKAKDYNIPLSAAVEHVHIIQGKTGADIHVLKALLSRAGVTWECLEDYAPQYEYTDGSNVFNQTLIPSYCVICRSKEEADKTTDLEKGVIGVYPLRYYADLKGNRFNEFEISDKWTICTNRFHMLKIQSTGGYGVCRVPPIPVDYVAKYRFTRRKIVLGDKVISHSIGQYSYSEAVAAEMFTKDTYKKYPKVMVKVRAWTYGARDIGSDLCLGLLETTELKQIFGEDVTELDVQNAEEI